MMGTWLAAAESALPGTIVGAGVAMRIDVAALFGQSWWMSPNVGRMAFAGLFALVVVWLLLIPARRIGQAGGKPPWWRNVRYWAIFAAAVQMMVYVFFG